MNRTTVDQIGEDSQRVEELIAELLLQHSGIRPPPRPTPGVVFVGFKDPWKKLSPEAKQLQSRILRDLDGYEPLVRVLLQGSAAVGVDIEQSIATIRGATEQTAGTYASTPQQVLDDVRAAFVTQREHLDALYDPTPGDDIYVPDANAIVWNPDLESWAFADSPKFTVVLTPTLLGELDDLKMRHRSDSVREKAESAIRRIKEYGRRGDLHDAVTLRGGRSLVRMIATEPSFDRALPWLDPTVKDDRLIASTLEIMRAHPRSRVVLVTRDINVQNKARHARIPFVEPPDPPEPAEGDQPRRRTRASQADIRILELDATGGSSGKINFYVLVQNYGGQPVRVTVSAQIDGHAVTCQPSTLDLLVNEEPRHVSIEVPRPEFGDLVPEFGGENATTLYGRELLIEVSVDGEGVTERRWSEHVYAEDENLDRHAIQERVWRIGLGEGTDADFRGEAQADLLRRHERA